MTALQKSPDLKQALRKEQDAIDQQDSLARELSSKLSQVGGATLDTQLALRADIVNGITSLKHDAGQAKNEETRLVCLRTFNQLWVEGIESGQAAMENNRDFARAEFYFQMMSDVTPNDPWPALLLAEANALRGDRKRACKVLREAIKRGLKNPEAIEKDANLQSMRPDPEFQQIIAGLRAQAGSQPAH